MESKKRKREMDAPRITFNAPNRTFERLLKESSLAEMCNTVAKKLGLDASLLLQFSQIRNGKSIDLEDEDDFDAFKSYAHSSGVGEVNIAVGTGSGSQKNIILSNSDRTAPSLARALMAGFYTLPVANGVPDGTSVVDIPTLQGVGRSEPQRLSNAAELTTTKRKPKPKLKGTQATPDAPPTNAARKVKKSLKSTLPEKGNKKLPISEEEHAPEATVTNIEVQMSPENAADRNTSSSEKAAPTPQSGGAALTSPTQEAQSKKKGGKKKTKPGLPPNVPTSEPAISPSDTLVSSGSPPPHPIPSDAPVAPPDSANRPSDPIVDTKKPKSRKSKASARSDTVDQAEAKTLVSSLPNGQIAEKRQSDGDQTSSTQTTKNATGDKRKDKKRKLEPEDKAAPESSFASKETNAKRCKIAEDSTVPATTADDTTEVNADGTITSKTLPETGKAKASATKKRKQQKPIGMSQLPADDEMIDKAIDNVLRKRVSESSKQTTSPTTVTTNASAVTNLINAETGPVSGSLPVEEEAKSKATKKAKNGKDAENLGMDSSVVEAKTTLPKTLLTRDGNFQDDTKKAVPRSRQDRAKAMVETDSGKEVSGEDITSLELPKATISTIPLAPSGSTISEIVIQGKGEGTGSESCSDSDDSDSDFDNEGLAVESKNQSKNLIKNASLDGPGPNTAFPIGDMNIDSTMDIDAILKPRQSLSWRDIPSPSGNESDEGKELMSEAGDADEDEEEDRRRKPPRIGMLSRRAASSSPSASEDDEDETTHPAEEAKSAREASPAFDTKSASTPVAENFPSKEMIGQIFSTQTKEEFLSVPRANEDTIDSGLPSLNGVNARGESVLSQGVADSAVFQAMEQDATMYFSGLRKTSRESSSASSSTSSEDLSEESEEEKDEQRPLKSSSQLAPRISAAAPTPQQSSTQPKEGRGKSGPNLLGPGTVARMKDRWGKSVASKESMSMPPAADNSSQPVGSTQSTRDEEKDKRKPAIKRAGAQKDVSGAASKRQAQGKKSQLETPKPTPSQNKTAKPSQAATIDSVGATSARHESISSQALRTGKLSGKVDNKADATTRPVNKEKPKTPHAVMDTRSGSTTEVEPSGNSEIVEKGSPPASSESEESDADHTVKTMSVKRLPRPSLASVRSLQDIAKQRDLFPAANTPRPSLSLSSVKPLQAATSKDGDNSSDEEDSSSSESSSDSDDQSNVAKEKRAGSLPSKPSRGLSKMFSFFGSAS